MAKAQQAQVIITANAKSAKVVMEELKRKAKECTVQMQGLAAAGKQNSEEFKELVKQAEAYNSASQQNVKVTKRIDEVVQNLATTSTRDLKRALGAAKREMDNFSGSEAGLQRLKENIAKVALQVRENTKIIEDNKHSWQKAMNDLAGTSTRELREAIADMKKDLDSLSETSVERPAYLNILHDLEDQLKRNEMVVKTYGRSWNSVMGDLQGTTTEALRRALAEATRTLEQMSGNSSNLGDVKKAIAQINEQIEKNTKAVNADGVAWQTAVNNLKDLSTETLTKALADAEQQLKKMSANSAGLEPLKIAIEQINSQIERNTKLLKNDAVSWQSVINNLNDVSTETLTKALADAQNQLKQMSGNSAELEPLKKAIEQINGQIERNTKLLKNDAVSWQSVINNLNDVSTETLTKALADAQNQLKQMSGNSAGLDQLKSSIAQINAQIEKNTKLAAEGGTEWRSVINTLESVSTEKLTQALADARKELNQMSGDNPALEQMKENVARITAQIEKNTKVVKRNAVAWRDVLNNLETTSIADLESALKNAREELSQMSATSADLDFVKEAIGQINLQLERNTKAVQQSGTSWRDVIDNLNDIPTNELTRALEDAKRELQELSGSSDSLDDVKEAIASISHQIDKNTSSVHENGVAWQSVINDLENTSTEDLVKALSEAEKEFKSLSANSDRLAEMRKNLARIKSQIEANTKEVHECGFAWRNSIGRLSTMSTNQLKSALENANKEFGEMTSRDADFEKIRSQIKRIKEQIEKNTGAVKKNGEAWNTTVRNISTYFGVFQMFSIAQEKLTKAFTDNFKLSDQIADIRKVSGLAIHDVNELSEALAKLDTRTTVEELHSIAYEGAKLGMGDLGASALEGFVRAANKVNVALKEELGDDALTALSKITEVMGLIPKYGVERSMEKVGSAMFQLSASSTASADNIVEFAKRLTGMSRAAGITTDELLALGSASDSMFLMPEVSSTAFNKMISAMQTNHNLIEKTLEIQPGTISRLFEAGHLMDAIVLVFEKMKALGNMNALQPVMGDLGSEGGARLNEVMVNMSKNVDMLKKHLVVAHESFADGTAVLKEYNIQQETAQAVLERANNIWEKAFINPEGVDMVKALADEWYHLSESMTANHASMFLMQGTLKTIIWLVKQLVKLVPVLLTAFMFKGALTALLSLGKSIGMVGQATVLATIRTQGLAAAWSTLNAVQKANVILMVISLLASLAIAIADCVTSTDEATEAMKGFDSALKGFHSDYARAREELDRYTNAITKTAEGTNLRRAAIENFNEKFGSYMTNLLDEKSTLEDLAVAYEQVLGKMRAKIALQLREKDYETHVNPRVGWEAERLYEYDQIAAMYQEMNGKWLRALVQDRMASGASIESIHDELAKTFGVNGEVAKLSFEKRSSAAPESILDVFTGDGGFGSFDMEVAGRSFDTFEEMMFAADRYLAQAFATRSARSKVDRKWEPFEDDFSQMETEDRERQKALAQQAEDKDAKKKARAEATAQRKAWRDELKAKQEEAKAVIANIKNFYERQKTDVLQDAQEQNWDEVLTNSAIEAIERRENLALSNARKAIAGVKNEWDAFKAEMDQDLRESADKDTGYNESADLLERIRRNDLNKLHSLMVQLSASLGDAGNSAIDAIWRNASSNEKQNQSQAWKQQQKLNARLLEDNYTAKVDREFSEGLTDIGFFNLDPAQVKVAMEGGSTAKVMMEARAKDIESVLKNAREHIVDLYNMDMGSAADRNRFLSVLLGPDWQDSPTQLTKLKTLTADEIRVFYSELLKYSDAYTDAQRKVHEKSNARIAYKWEASDMRKHLGRKESLNQLHASGYAHYSSDPDAESLPSYGIYGNRHMMQSFGVDPEVEAYRLKLEAAKAYYDFLRAQNADAQTIRAQERAMLEAEMAYAQSVGEHVRQQMDDVLQLFDPISEFGTAVGKAFSTMTENTDEGRRQIKEAINDMTKAFLQQTLQISAEYLKREIMQKVHDRLTSLQIKKSSKKLVAEEKKKEDAITEVTQIAGTAKEQIAVQTQESITEGVSAAGKEAIAMQKAQKTQEVATEAAGAQASTSLGIASGAAKIIGKLGWWGIPLVAVITALLNGLLSFAMGKVSSLFGGGGKENVSNAPASKLVSGMLTYDAGNVQSFRGALDGKTYPVVGDDGRVYAARDGGELSTGLVRDPIATLVNGQPALVAERGPEMVIGRETTAAMMMSRPDLIQEIVKFDRNRSGARHKVFDAGNVSELLAQLPQQSGNAGGNELIALSEVITALSGVLSDIQRKGIPAHINKYGRGGIVEEAADGARFMRNYSNNPVYRK